jgi:hypothetical protein
VSDNHFYRSQLRFRDICLPSDIHHHFSCIAVVVWRRDASWAGTQPWPSRTLDYILDVLDHAVLCLKESLAFWSVLSYSLLNGVLARRCTLAHRCNIIYIILLASPRIALSQVTWCLFCETLRRRMMIRIGLVEISCLLTLRYPESRRPNA